MRRWQTSLMLCVTITVMAGCGDQGPDIDIESSIPVRVEEVTAGPMKEYAFATGTLVAAEEATLDVQQSGYYHLQTNPRTGTTFAMGDQVRKGDTIITLQNAEFENQVAIDSKKLNHEISEREFEKQKGLYEKGGVTMRELADAEQSFIDARYAYENAKLQLAKLQIVAPFDGILVDLPFYSPGQLVESDATMAQIMDYRHLYAEVTLPGKEMERVERGQTAIVTNYADPLDTLTGQVTQVSPTLDPDNRMFKLTLEIDNDSLSFRPGMFAKIDIVVEERDSTLVIPKDIIQERHGAQTVFVVDKGIAVERRIETGLSNREQVEVVNGLEAGDRLVVEGFETLRHRSKVKVTK